MYVSHLATCQANVDALSEKATTATEPNTYLQQGYRDIRANLVKLEDNMVTLLEKHEGLLTDVHLGPSYQQICDSIRLLNEHMTRIEPRCLLFFIEPEMSSHYFRNAIIPDFFLTVHWSPGFFKALFLFRQQIKTNKAQDRFYFALLEQNLKLNEKDILLKILAQERPDNVEEFLYKLVTRFCMPKQYEMKMRQALKKMGRMNIIQKGQGTNNIAEELDRIYKFHCVLENSQLCSEYWSQLYPQDSQTVDNIMARGICTDDFVAHLL